MTATTTTTTKTTTTTITVTTSTTTITITITITMGPPDASQAEINQAWASLQRRLRQDLGIFVARLREAQEAEEVWGDRYRQGAMS